MKKLPAKAQWIVLPFFLTLIMTAIVSAISTVHALGVHGVFHIWLGSWLFSWAIAFPTLVFNCQLSENSSGSLLMTICDRNGARDLSTFSEV